MLQRGYVSVTMTYAAVAAKVSDGFATVAKDIRARKITINEVIIASFIAAPSTYSRIHSGATSMTNPTTVMTIVTNASINSSDI